MDTRAPRRLAPLLLAPLLLGGALTSLAAADVVTTRDGLRVEGQASRLEDGRWRVATPDGEVFLRADDVVAVVEGAAPRARIEERLEGLAADDVAGHYKLALEATAEGQADLARRSLERVLVLDPDHRAARRALGFERVGERWLTHDEACLERGLVLFDGSWRLPAEVEKVSRATRTLDAGARDGRVTRLLAQLTDGDAALSRAVRLRLASLEHRELLDGALEALYDRRPAVRRVAAQALAELGDEAALRRLLFSAVRDADADVRHEAVEAARSFGHPDAAVPLVKALASENEAIVAHAAQALGELGDHRAISYLVKRMVSGGDSPRSFVAFLNEISYVRDYDVEIAQASNIANPDVATLREGVILDADVLGTVMTRTWIEPIIVDAVGKLAGRQFANAEEVRAWYLAHKDELPRFESSAKSRAPHRPQRGRILGAPLLD
ncbi:MAG: HEAT repeat domain-containing protein [Planctomycetes bacterium]|nr:HEAT repeat domain-containing protein [Planctomycetota bacterium]MCB9824923.1 HEAT repeat domain-containing protein [Planctomycetota bacterium]MCB9830290.1 HEAT repeat domain-containing protein [Planctomycetota bacterium]MCB9902192.1 HEAT repeat domain-containing protein [Planctomycetota bacterium]